MLYSRGIPNNLGVIFRKTYKSLCDSTLKDFEKYTGLKTNSERNATLPNGSIIMFRYIDEIDSINQQNINLGWYLIEQAEELATDNEFYMLFGRLRREVEPSAEFIKLQGIFGLPLRTGMILANATKGWIKELWKDGKIFEAQRRINYDGVFAELIEAKTEDNKDNLPPDFMQSLEIIKETKPGMYRRFVLNDWEAEIENKVFRNIMNCIAGENEAPQPQFQYTMGVDLAKTVDFTVLTVLNRQTKHVAYWERFNSVSWNLQKERIKAIAQKYNNALVVPDSTGVGDPIVEDLQRAGVGVYYPKPDVPGIKFNNINKENMIEKLQVALEQRMITFPKHEALIQELEDFECEVLPSKRLRYGAPGGKHDDCVISLALALWAVEGGMYQSYTPPKEPTSAEDFWKRVRRDTKRFDEMNATEYESRTIDPSNAMIV